MLFRVRFSEFRNRDRLVPSGAGHFHLEEEIMSAFQAQRVIHEYTQSNEAPPERVFPLLCPVREVDWLPGWRHSQSGVAENGCVFGTPNEDGTETIWVVADYDPTAFRISFVWVRPGMVACRLTIALEARAREKTATHIRFTYTALSPEGSKEVEQYSQAWFEDKMRNWETTINRYLRTGQKLAVVAH
jgi:hypothetical protein